VQFRSVGCGRKEEKRIRANEIEAFGALAKEPQLQFRKVNQLKYTIGTRGGAAGEGAPRTKKILLARKSWVEVPEAKLGSVGSSKLTSP